VQRGRLISGSGQVVGQLLHGVGGVAGLDVFGVVGDEEGLFGLDNDDAFLALERDGSKWLEFELSF
jgi:hypothetical protein